MKKLYFLTTLLVLLFLSGIASNAKAQNGPELYFCEQYKDGEEIGVSSRFTPGWLTVMIDLRLSNRTFGTGKVKLQLSKIKNEYGNEIPEIIVDTVPFEVQPEWDYTYFTDKSNLKFSEPGTYRVICQKVDGTPIVSGEVEIVPK